MKHCYPISTALCIILSASTASAQEPADTVAGISEQQLDELVITAKAPTVRVTPDKTVYDLKSTVMGQNGTMLDALGSIPGVNISADGAVSLYGNRGAAITVDGKKIYLKGRELANYLRSLPAAAVNTVALRTTANARDDASDKSGVIEISTRRERQSGTTLGLNGGISAWSNLKANGSVSLAWNKGRSELSLLYSAFGARQRIHLDIDRHYITDENRMLQSSGRRRSDNAHLMKLGWGWNFSPQTSLLTSVSLSRNCRNERGLTLETEVKTPKGGILIYPLLLIPLVENAFKHLGGEPMVSIRFGLAADGMLELQVSNSIYPRHQSKDKSPSGLGLANLRRRLGLLYPDGGHTLEFSEASDRFTATLRLKPITPHSL